ncbi:MAG: hypothetical protein PSN35_07065 [Candidatus Thioglobus sp.]|uniref:hypothetical protein n=1 Tax=Candidatus Thioglobus sp. TaxID=2026721 RepID=UPI00260EFC1B|nr:hypothetical protein [Candidatus Thioglobus sp.]MDC9727578.1 hypothetical protein [Candidatus Thioglobus sp.]
MALKDSNLINNSWFHGIPRAILSITHGFMALKGCNLINNSWIHGIPRAIL